MPTPVKNPHGRMNRIDGLFLCRTAWMKITAIGIIFMAGCAVPTVNPNDNAPGPDTGNGDETPSLDPDALSITEGDWYRPPVQTTWHWQLQPGETGGINAEYQVDLYDVDLFDVSESQIAMLQERGIRVICYFSAGSFEDFRSDADQFLSADLGLPLSDFADENWLDIRSINVAEIMLRRLDLADQKGCDGVEPDNVDGYQNDTGFNLTALDQLAFNRFIANESHRRGLSVGLKNDLDQIADLVEFFDFSVNEQCHEFDECELLQPFIQAGKPVFNAEYAERFVTNNAEREMLCDDALAAEFRTLVLPIDLDDSFRFSCDP